MSDTEANGPTSEPQTAAPAPIKRASLRRNAISNTVGHMSFFGVIFVLTPLAIRHLGPEGWGIWQLVGATAAYSMLLDLGLTTAMHYQVALNAASGDNARLAAAFTNVRIYYLCAGAVLLLGLWVGGRPLIAGLVTPEEFGPAYSTLVIAIVLTAATMVLRLYPTTLGGLQRLDIIGVLNLGAAAILFCAVYFGFRFGMGLHGFAALMTLAPILIAFPSWFLVRRVLPREALRWTRFDPALFKELVGYSLSTLMYTAGAVVLYQTMKFVASWRLGGAEAAGHMGLVISLVQILSVVFTPILIALLARVGHMKGEGRVGEVPQLLDRALIATGALLVPALAFMIVDATLIFDAWVGTSVPAEVTANLGQTARLMLIGQGAYIFALPCYYTLTGIGEHRVFGIAMFVVAIANSLFGWFAAGFDPRMQSLGLVFSILMTLLAGTVTIPVALRRFPIPVGPVLAKALGAPLLAALPGVLAITFRPRLGQPIGDIAVDAVLFGGLCIPGLEFIRRRFVQAAPGANGEGR